MHRFFGPLRIKPYLLRLAIVLAALLAVTPTMAAQVLDRIVAVVNDDVVLQSELEQEVATITAQLRQRNIPMPDEQTLTRQVLERLIMQRLQLAVAERSGIRVDEATLNAAVQRIAEQNNLSLSQFRATLENEGFDYSTFRDNLRNEIILTRLHQRQAENRVNVSPQEIEEYLASQSAGNTTEYLVGHILIAMPENASAEQIQRARQRAEEVHRLLVAGDNLAQLAASYSDSPTALDGGSLGWRSQGELPTLFANQVPRLAVGETGPIVQSPSGFHLIQLLDRRSSDQAVITQTHARHILIRPNAVVSDQDARTRLETLRQRIQNGADFGELARANSDDKGSASQGGDLGWASPGTFVPSFEQAMAKLAPGQISEPFQSNFGWHIVQVLERRQRDATDELRRAKAAEAIRQRKSEEALEAWLRQLREEAYVDIRLEA
ncbi:MAG TPA: peptidylprolyl isomerase [Gammaproteobacteria bacterium]|nr:peptidylprolyl isomerase [Gammaproteobacteria bacterium]